MARNLQQVGAVIPHLAPAGGVVSGQFFLVQSTLCVALSDAAQGEEVEVAIAGVYRDCPSDTATTFGPFTPLYWDGSKVTVSDEDGPFVGICIGGKLESAATCSIKLVQGTPI